MGQKSGATDSMATILSDLKRLKKVFTGRFLGKFVVKWILKIPPYLAYVAYVAALPCHRGHRG